MSDEPLGDVVPALTRVLTPTGVPVSTLIPNPRPASLIRLTPTGGSSDHTWLAHVMVTVEAWAPTPAAARALAAQARTLILGGAETDDLIHDAEATWPVAYDDPETPSHRATFTTTLTII
jgi:hypothetical protein|nr:MAG TPA: tail completion protein [Caudoviricetes sp.]